MYDELLLNEHFPLPEQIIKQSLIKAVRLHEIATSDNSDKNVVCKYYDKEYNIIRNENIGIRHIFALLLYTDDTEFCIAFREACRIMKKTEASSIT